MPVHSLCVKFNRDSLNHQRKQFTKPSIPLLSSCHFSHLQKQRNSTSINLLNTPNLHLRKHFLFSFFYSSAHVPKLSLFTACSTINVQLRADVLCYSIRVASMPPAHLWPFISGLRMGCRASILCLCFL